MKEKSLKRYIVLLLATVLYSGCATISSFDQYAYVQVTSVKVDVLNLMDMSVDAYSSHENDVEEVTSKLMKAVEYEKHRPLNRITLAMWNRLFKVDSIGVVDEKTMIASYLKKWKQDGKQRPAFIKEAKGQVGEGFDLIAELEASKIKPSDSKIQKFLSK